VAGVRITTAPAAVSTARQPSPAKPDQVTLSLSAEIDRRSVYRIGLEWTPVG
jgi:hypothetical protein